MHVRTTSHIHLYTRTHALTHTDSDRKGSAGGSLTVTITTSELPPTGRCSETLPFTVSVACAFNAPLPAQVPPLHASGLVTLTEPAPSRVPPTNEHPVASDRVWAAPTDKYPPDTLHTPPSTDTRPAMIYTLPDTSLMPPVRFTSAVMFSVPPTTVTREVNVVGCVTATTPLDTNRGAFSVTVVFPFTNSEPDVTFTTVALPSAIATFTRTTELPPTTTDPAVPFKLAGLFRKYVPARNCSDPAPWVVTAHVHAPPPPNASGPSATSNTDGALQVRGTLSDDVVAFPFTRLPPLTESAPPPEIVPPLSKYSVAPECAHVPPSVSEPDIHAPPLEVVN